MTPPACTDFQIVTVMPAPAQDKLTTELLKIIDETESKVTFAVVMETLGERCDNWDAVIPAVIRKADKMGWMRLNDKEFGDKFAENLAELIAAKARKPQKDAPCGAEGCGCSDCECCPACCPDRAQDVLKRSVCTGTISFVVGGSADVLPMPRCDTEMVPMPHAAEVLPMMPQAAEVPVFDFWSSFVR